jgi:hypothetical protein
MSQDDFPNKPNSYPYGQTNNPYVNNTPGNLLEQIQSNNASTEESKQEEPQTIKEEEKKEEDPIPVEEKPVEPIIEPNLNDIFSEDLIADNDDSHKTLSSSNVVIDHIFDEDRWLAPVKKPKADDGDAYVYALTPGTKKDIDNLITNIQEEYTARGEPDRLSEIFTNTEYTNTTWLGLITVAYYRHQNAVQEALYQQIKELEQENVNLKPITEFPQYSDKRPSSLTVKDKFTTTEAIIAANICTKGIKHINLLHSGFSIDITRPGMNKINALYTAISETKAELGKQTGMIFYHFSDVLIRKTIVEHLHANITGSTFKDWRKYNSFLKALNILDYDTLLWGIISLLYPEGYTFSILCSHKDCANTEHVNLDLNNLKIVNYNKLQNINTSFSIKDKTLEEILEYQDNMFKATITTNDHPDWIFEMKSPSAYDFFESGDRFIGSILKSVNTPKPENLQDDINASYYRILAPWIKSFTQKFPNGESKTIVHDVNLSIDTAKGSETNIERLMPSFQTVDNTLHQDIHTYIRNQQMIYYGIYYPECPKCKRPNEFSKSGFIPIDVQLTFFLLAEVKLLQNRLNLTRKTDTEISTIS